MRLIASLRERGGPLAVEGVNKNSLSLAYARQLPREGALTLADASVIGTLQCAFTSRILSIIIYARWRASCVHYVQKCLTYFVQNAENYIKLKSHLAIAKSKW